MAGIGFELKKIYRKESISRGMIGIVYSSVVTVGPMLMVIAAILLLYLFLEMTKVSYADRELLSSTILYTFIFSVILTSPFNVVFSRYLADKFYTEEYSNILASYYTGNSLCCILATVLFLPVGWSLRVRGSIDLPFILAAYIQWISLVILFFAITYLHATKDYKIIALFFFIGMAACIVTALAFYNIGGRDAVHSIIYGLAAGFFLIAVLDFSYIKRYFRSVSKEYGECLPYLLLFKKLLAANLLYILGLYVHNFIFWTVPSRLHVAATFYSHQAYDMASCLAMFTNISVMVSFMVVVETRFHNAYKEYMEGVIGGTYKMIVKARKKLFRTLSQQIIQVFGTQAAITSVIFLFLILFGTKIGFDGVTMAIYPVLTVSFLGIFMMYGNIIYLYYFADMTGAVVTGALFFTVTLAGSLFSRTWPIPFWGGGVFLGMLAGWTFSFFRIRWIERNLDTFIFCDYKVIDTMKSSSKGKVIYRKKENNAAR
ncbi:exopolysaccharide Pel transporter PelG [Dorea sp. D27]|uniref:exopolysaccharide Pel transporter PelG n=1 Tax=Dorea sp. D27 TaxID=658665 RepID=UPI0006738EE1|nr:exopolysaccharide Pel transporter PelG [Dorea sp. D27]KMZ55356.1 putative transmembrane protein,-like protein [Dorea sp. D27]